MAKTIGAVTLRRAVDVRGVVLLFIGAALAGIAFHSLTWYSVEEGADSAGAGFTFADLHTNADQLGAPVATAYFDTLAWGLIGLVVLVGLASKISSRAATTLRVGGFLIGIAGILLTYYALAELFNAQRVAGGSDHGVLHSSSVGLWSAAAGYLISGLGAVLAAPARPQ